MKLGRLLALAALIFGLGAMPAGAQIVMKAGTATKMVLNAITTLSMIQLGKVHGNLMVDLNRQACAKLRDRAVRVVQQATGVDRETAASLLLRAGEVKTAIVMHLRRVDRDAAERLLQQAGGRVRTALNASKCPAGGPP